MRLYLKYHFAGLAILTLTIPVWAKKHKESVDIVANSTIGGTQLSPGSYELAADDTAKDLNVLQNGKVVATVHGQWIKIPRKAEAPAFVSDGDKITEVEFSGSDQAFKVQ